MSDLREIGIKYSTANDKLTQAESVVREQQMKLRELRAAQGDAQAELDRLIDLERTDHAARVLDGEDAAPKKPKRLTRIANLQETLAGTALAIPIQQARLSEAEMRAQECQQEIAEAIIPDLFNLKEVRLNRCEGPLSELIEAMIDAAAVDVLQEKISRSGTRLVLRQGLTPERLFSAGAILTKFRKNLPPRFLDLTANVWPILEETINNRADVLAREIGA
jgi:hypothetical protein